MRLALLFCICKRMLGRTLRRALEATCDPTLFLWLWQALRSSPWPSLMSVLRLPRPRWRPLRRPVLDLVLHQVLPPVLQR
jgi:hypothetical protein